MVDPNAEKLVLFSGKDCSNPLFEGSMLQVVTERQSYNPGDTVRGAIYIRANNLLDCRAVHLDFFGREEAR